MTSEADADADTDATDPDPNAPNRLKPLPGSTTKKPEPPAQRKVPPKVSPEHTDVSIKSDQFRKDRDENENIKGNYLVQGDSEAVDDLPAGMQKKIDNAKNLDAMTTDMASSVN